VQKSAIYCSSCSTLIPFELFNTDQPEECNYCHRQTYAFAFPALIRPPEQANSGEQILVEGDASCFFHPQKKAEISCEYCGRFLCSLCDIEFAGKHLCAACIESGKKKKTLKTLEDRRVLYDDLALALAIIPMILFYVVVITAPISIFMSIRHWNSPSSLIPRRTKLRFTFAILISVMQLVGIGALIYLVTTGFHD
jgi:hypothetical protein